MNFFEEATLRLKQQAGVTKEQDVAALLGLSKTSWSGRKKRGNFPEIELYALAAKHPDLNLDVDYVLTGITHAAHARLAANQAAGERARERGTSFSEGWKYNDTDLERAIQRAKEKDPKGFLAWTQLFLALPKEKLRLLHPGEVGGTLLEMLFFCIIASCGILVSTLGILGGSFATNLTDFATCFSIAAAPMLAIALLRSSARPAYHLLRKRVRDCFF